MIIGVPKEIKVHEYRVGLNPSSVHSLTALGHEVIIEDSAGLNVGYSNEDYEALASGEKPLIVAHHLSYVLYKCFMSCEYYSLFIPKANFYGENMVAQQKYVDNIIDCIGETDGFVEFSTYVAMNKRPGINTDDFHDAAGNLGMFFSGMPTANELIVPLSDNALRDELAFHAKGKWHLVD